MVEETLCYVKFIVGDIEILSLFTNPSVSVCKAKLFICCLNTVLWTINRILLETNLEGLWSYNYFR